MDGDARSTTKTSCRKIYRLLDLAIAPSQPSRVVVVVVVVVVERAGEEETESTGVLVCKRRTVTRLHRESLIEGRERGGRGRGGERERGHRLRNHVALVTARPV